MLFHKFFIRMTSAAGLRNIGKVGHRFGIFAWPDIMLPVTVLTKGDLFRALHDHLGMKTLLVFFFRLLMAGRTVHPLFRGLHSCSMGIIPNLGMTSGTGKAAMDGTSIFCLGHKERDLSSRGILLGQEFIFMAAKASRIIGSPNPSGPDQRDNQHTNDYKNFKPLVSHFLT
jgi:hypothetical protein